MQARLDTRSVFMNGSVSVAGALDRRGCGVYRSDMSVYHRDGLVIGGIIIVSREKRP
jgi:hypothetical protein